MNLLHLAETTDAAATTSAPAAMSTPAAAALPDTAPDSLGHLTQRMYKRVDDLLVMLGNPYFYIEVICIAGAFAVAAFLAAQLKHKIQRRFEVSPPKFIDAGFITKPLLLLRPVMTLICLWLVQLLLSELGIGGGFTAGLVQLCYAYILAKAVVLVIHSRPVAYFIATAIMVDAVLHAIRVTKSTSAYLSSLAFDVGQYHFSVLNLMHGLVILVVVFWAAGVLSRTLEDYLRRSSSLSYSARELTVKFVRLFVYFVAFLITLSAIGVDLTAFAVFSGALGVGIGLGLQKLTANFVSGITMLMEKSIKLGDLIEVGGNTGWVRQLNIRYALIETSDGREILIPNEELLSTRVTNWTLTTPKASIEIKVIIDFDSDAIAAREIMLAAALEHPRCLPDPAPICLLRAFVGNGLEFGLTFWIGDVKLGRGGPQSEVMFTILERFHQANIHLARSA